MLFTLSILQVSSVMTDLLGLTNEHNAQVAQMKSCHPDVRFPSLFTEIFELPKTMSTSTPERKKPDMQQLKSPVLDVSRDSLDISSGVEPVSPPSVEHNPGLMNSIYDTNDFNMFMTGVPKDTSDYGTSANSSDIDSGTNR